jgi:hypothetical protein
LALYITDYSVWPVIKALSGTLIFVSINEMIRFRSSRFERLYEKVLGFLMRENEKVRSSVFFYTTIKPRNPGTSKWGCLVFDRGYFCPGRFPVRHCSYFDSHVSITSTSSGSD